MFNQPDVCWIARCIEAVPSGLMASVGQVQAGEVGARRGERDGGQVCVGDFPAEYGRDPSPAWYASRENSVSSSLGIPCVGPRSALHVDDEDGGVAYYDAQSGGEHQGDCVIGFVGAMCTGWIWV